MKPPANNLQPFDPPMLEQHGGFFVVRDDLLPGGTKRRALVRLLRPELEYVYASPAYGHAQLALALAAVDKGSLATVFVAARKTLHPLTQAAEAAGALIKQVRGGYLRNVQAAAARYCTGGLLDTDEPRFLLPFGLDAPATVAAMAEVARRVDYAPPEVWCAAGSGVLTRALQQAWPDARHYAVQVGRKPNVGKAVWLIAPEKYENPAKLPPPWPSCTNYDAKVWQFFSTQAAPGALFWNVAP